MAFALWASGSLHCTVVFAVVAVVAGAAVVNTLVDSSVVIGAERILYGTKFLSSLLLLSRLDARSLDVSCHASIGTLQRRILWRGMGTNGRFAGYILSNKGAIFRELTTYLREIVH
uniref:Putative secreted protein n=1 Tax=Anopheles darlingi TaxID=43151 RepID=A0A2M4D562_ANODA